jgi:hypothetical protein
MKKQKTKKNKRSPIDCENSVRSDEKQTENLEQASAFVMKIFTATLWTPFKLLNTSEEEAKGLCNWTRRGQESAAWRRSRTTIATQKNKSVDAQNLKEEGSHGRLFFSLPICPKRLLARFSAVGLASGHQTWVFTPPAPFPWPGF